MTEQLTSDVLYKIPSCCWLTASLIIEFGKDGTHRKYELSTNKIKRRIPQHAEEINTKRISVKGTRREVLKMLCVCDPLEECIMNGSWTDINVRKMLFEYLCNHSLFLGNDTALTCSDRFEWEVVVDVTSAENEEEEENAKKIGKTERLDASYALWSVNASDVAKWVNIVSSFAFQPTHSFLDKKGIDTNKLIAVLTRSNYVINIVRFPKLYGNTLHLLNDFHMLHLARKIISHISPIAIIPSPSSVAAKGKKGGREKQKNTITSTVTSFRFPLCMRESIDRCYMGFNRHFVPLRFYTTNDASVSIDHLCFPFSNSSCDYGRYGTKKEDDTNIPICAICLESFPVTSAASVGHGDDVDLEITRCGHVFCWKCIQRWALSCSRNLATEAASSFESSETLVNDLINGKKFPTIPCPLCKQDISSCNEHHIPNKRNRS